MYKVVCTQTKKGKSREDTFYSKTKKEATTLSKTLSSPKYKYQKVEVKK